MHEYTTQQADDLYELISDRTRAGSIIVTSNRPPQDWYALFPNPVLAEGALDRPGTWRARRLRRSRPA